MQMNFGLSGSKRILFITGWFILSLNALVAQQNAFVQYGLEEGLSSSKVFTTIEDGLGFLWVASTAGIDRFDGTNFKHYELSNLEQIRKSSFYRFYLARDKDDQIWLLSNSGLLYKYSVKTDDFALFYDMRNQIGGDLNANGLLIDRQGTFWVISELGVHTFLPALLAFEPFQDIAGSIHSIAQDDDDNLYFAGSEGVFAINDDYQLTTRFLEESQNAVTDMFSGRTHSLFVDEEYGRLWMGNDQQGLCAFDLSTFEFLKPSGLEHLEGLEVRAIKQYTPESLVAGIDGVGLFILDLDTLVPIDSFSSQKEVPNSLSSNSIFDIYENKDGVFFISTFRGGLNALNPFQLKINAHIQNAGDVNSLENNNILSIYEIEPGKIGFGTSKGVSIWNKDRNSWQHLSEIASKNNLLSGFVHAIAVDEQENLWTSSYTDSIIHYVPDASAGYRISNQVPTGFNDRNVHQIFPLGKRVYFSNGSSGVMEYDLKSRKTRLYPKPGLRVISALYNRKLALGGNGGLWVLNTKRNRFEKPNFIDSSIVDNQIINTMLTDSDGILWVGTADQGVFSIDFEKERIKQIAIGDGLPSNYIFSMVASGNSIWLSTNQGISRIDANGDVYNLFQSDGLISTDFNNNVALRDSDGLLYFGTNKGVIYFDPADIKPVSIAKNIVLTDLYVNHELTLPGDNSPLSQGINSTKRIALSYAQSSFALGVGVIDFIQPGIGKLEWKLEGNDQHWISYDKVDRIHYTNVGAGTYTFRVRMVNEKGRVIANEKKVEFIISPPFWRAPLAFVIYIILVGLIVFVVVYFGNMKIESKKSEERLHFLINMAHEMKTPLTLIKAPIQETLKSYGDDVAISQNLNIALESADRLQDQMIQFLDFRKFKLRRKAMVWDTIHMQQYFDDKELAYRVLCEQKKLNLTFEISSRKIWVKTDQKIIDVVISNLISNAIKYTREHGLIHVKFDVTDQTCSVTIKDTGIGIPRSQQGRIFRLFYRAPEAQESGIPGSGVGLVLASDLAKKINGKVELVKSSNSGSVFKFSFPFTPASPSEIAAVERTEFVKGEQVCDDQNKPKILFVEDDEQLRKYAESQLQAKYQVSTAIDGSIALEKANEFMPDVIISDVSMPKMNGRQLCMNLKQNMATCHIPVILLTGLSSKENIVQGLESGADAYITKPFEFDILHKKIESLLENRQIIKRKFLQSAEEEESFMFSNKLDQAFIDDITRYIEENLSDPELSVNELCALVGMSRSAFYHKLKLLIDLSPADLIRSIRFKNAVALLKDPNNRIGEVAYSVGFSDPKYFSTSFKKYFGKSPSTFVAQLRNHKLED